MRKYFLFLLVACHATILFGQTNAGFWNPKTAETAAALNNSATVALPRAFSVFELDDAGLRAQLALAPFRALGSASNAAISVILPTPSGQSERFSVWETSMMQPGLAAKYPAIKTYAGVSEETPGKTLRMGIGYAGFHAFILHPDGSHDAILHLEGTPDNLYLAYKSEDVAGLSARVACGAEDHEVMDKWVAAQQNTNRQPGVSERGGQAPVNVRSYRMAVASKSEYSSKFGNNSGLILNSIVQAINYLNGVTERDFGVHLDLIDNTDTLFFYDAANDPYVGNEVGNWMNQNPGAINPLIGSTSYDVGHVFAEYITGFAIGVANWASVCSVNDKARGCSARNFGSPVEEFYNTFIHEFCHQLSGTHSWNYCSDEANNQLSAGTAYEPGSGSTIMSYNNACGNNNIGNASTADHYYHIANILQVTEHVFTNPTGSGCGTLVTSANTTPVLNINFESGLYVPISTPLKLSATATDAENSNLTYCWEQFDLGGSVPLGTATGTAPLFRSYPPSTSGTRYLPTPSIFLNNQTSIREILPDYNRIITFRCTVRDNNAGAGGVTSEERTFRSTTQAGPFVVTYPNALSDGWVAGEYQEVTWDVANTDQALVNCQAVNIKLVIGGNFNNLITLAEAVPNNGRYCLQVPNNVTNSARIMVEAADNIFFDVSNANFPITAAVQPEFSLCAERLQDVACLPYDYTLPISTSGVGNFTTPVTLTASGLPPGITATFSPNPVTPGAESLLTLSFMDGLAESTIDYTVQGNTGNPLNLRLTLVQNNFDLFAPIAPSFGQSGVSNGPVFKWVGVPDANYYEVEMASNPNFNQASILASGTSQVDSFLSPLILQDGQLVYWRVRPVNECGVGPWSETNVFITAIQSCNTFSASDLPKNISGNSTPTVESKITVATGGALSDVNITTISGNHNSFSDLEVNLIGPDNTTVLLWKNKCGNITSPFNLGFDDASAITTFPCGTLNNGTIVKPTGALNSFNGQSAAGVWTLRVKDNVIGSGGSISNFALQLCSGVSLNAPVIVNNNLLQLDPGTNAAVATNFLQTTDANNTADQLTYTLVSEPKNGILQLNGLVLETGSQFKQTDIDNGFIRYYDYGLNVGADEFKFAVTDGEGGLAAGTFTIQPLPVGTQSPLRQIAFQMAPNPANNTVNIAFAQALSADAQIALFDAAGRQVRQWNLGAGMVFKSLEVQDLASGVYALMLTTAEGSAAKKLVINR